jgi:cell division protein FtsW (lipid II flippase)
MENTTTFSIMIKQMNFIIAGLVVIFICHLIPLRVYRTLSYLVIWEHL